MPNHNATRETSYLNIEAGVASAPSIFLKTIFIIFLIIGASAPAYSDYGIENNSLVDVASEAPLILLVDIDRQQRISDSVFTSARVISRFRGNLEEEIIQIQTFITEPNQPAFQKHRRYLVFLKKETLSSSYLAVKDSLGVFMMDKTNKDQLLQVAKHYSKYTSAKPPSRNTDLHGKFLIKQIENRATPTRLLVSFLHELESSPELITEQWIREKLSEEEVNSVLVQWIFQTIEQGERTKLANEIYNIAKEDRFSMRKEAIALLARLKMVKHHDFILSYLQDEDPNIRFIVAEALGLLGLEKSAAPLFDQYLVEDRSFVQVAILESLQRLPGKETEEVIDTIEREKIGKYAYLVTPNYISKEEQSRNADSYFLVDQEEVVLEGETDSEESLKQLEPIDNDGMDHTQKKGESEGMK